MIFERESAVEGYTEKGWMRVEFERGVKCEERVVYVIGRGLS